MDAESPEKFRFTVKAHQVLTHIKRLKGTEEFLPRFLQPCNPWRKWEDGADLVPASSEYESGRAGPG